MRYSTRSRAFPHPLVKILSSLPAVQCGSLSMWKKECADLPSDMPFHQFLLPFVDLVILG